ncbi:MAG: hypothetical protein J6O41_03810 [Clostridia bacterium]|nr:hypothetical protein [Clostridia bacterium]
MATDLGASLDEVINTSVLFDELLEELLYVSKTTVRTYINDFYFEVGILATFNNLITKSMFSS